MLFPNQMNASEFVIIVLLSGACQLSVFVLLRL